MTIQFFTSRLYTKFELLEQQEPLIPQCGGKRVGKFLEQKDSVFTMFIISYLDPKWLKSILTEDQVQDNSAEALDLVASNLTEG